MKQTKDKLELDSWVSAVVSDGADIFREIEIRVNSRPFAGTSS